MNPEREAFLKAIRLSCIVQGVLAVAAGGIAGAVGGGSEAWAAVLGVGAAAFVSVSTLVAMIMGSRRSPAALAAIVLFSYAAKMAILLGLLWVASRSEDFPRLAFAIPLLVGAVANLAVDIVIITKARVPYATPGQSREAG